MKPTPVRRDGAQDGGAGEPEGGAAMRVPDSDPQDSAAPPATIRWDYAWFVPAGARPGAAASPSPSDAIMQADLLTGAMFTTPKELRHMAEQEFGALFVPTEVVAASPGRITLALTVPGVERLLVHAERERRWYPYRVTRVERRPLDRVHRPSSASRSAPGNMAASRR